jgi:hypothetical protein
MSSNMMGGRTLLALLLLAPLLKLGVAQTTCSKQCDASNLCAQDAIVDCQVTCDNTGVTSAVGACSSSDFSQSDVQCVGGDSCAQTVFNQSKVTCTDVSCRGVLFYASAVTCEVSSSCIESFLYDCSCCDSSDNSCPSTVPSCTTDLVTFCSSVYLGSTCKEWGNPVCDGLTIGT